MLISYKSKKYKVEGWIWSNRISGKPYEHKDLWESEETLDGRKFHGFKGHNWNLCQQTSEACAMAFY